MVGAGQAVGTTACGLWRTREFRTWADESTVPLTTTVSEIAEELGLRNRVKLVATISSSP